MADDNMITTNDDNNELQILTLEFEDDSKLDCGVVALFTIEEQDYIALSPLDDDQNFMDEMEILLYRYNEIGEEDDAFTLDDIEDEEEREIVQEVFDKIMNEDVDVEEGVLEVDSDPDQIEYQAATDEAPAFSASSDDAMVQDILNRIINDKKY